MWTKLFAAVMLCAILGCGPNPDGSVRIDQMHVYFEAMPPSKKACAIYSIQTQKRAFEADFGCYLPKTYILVSNDTLTDPLSGIPNSVTGYNLCQPGPIGLWTDSDGACPACYHEFGHTLFGKGHQLPIWVFIDQRAQEIVKKLREEWKNK